MAIEIKNTELSNRLTVLSISGRITALTAPDVKNQVRSLVSNGLIDMIFDLKETVFIDSSGLSAIVSALKQAREAGGALKLAGLQSDVQTIFKITMLDRVFEMYPTVEAAIESIKTQ